ncbi:hypothetical protein BJF79_35195 [Actinomadura sp. CNU-125]|uniref:hypothetical protein n=1 Tax=Actinomadura sp. CNU-125 TaxID=1904961 RepID=UPI00095FEE32|nr:hypothetical protein [Actinomadura sp. CNU-125]OLT33101.1 hypothetical protein BJF79_35195 [Actinomadura sp. CNU-125]
MSEQDGTDRGASPAGPVDRRPPGDERSRLRPQFVAGGAAFAVVAAAVFAAGVLTSGDDGGENRGRKENVALMRRVPGR